MEGNENFIDYDRQKRIYNTREILLVVYEIISPLLSLHSQNTISVIIIYFYSSLCQNIE